MTSPDIRSLEPRALWNAFANLNAVPRPSKREARIVAFVREFAQKHGLTSIIDSGGNVIITKSATPDRQDRPPLILQAHLDMVHKAADGLTFDFDQQGIDMRVDGDWVRARGTTLGADNGLGVAAILAILASTDLPHPPIEALFTIDEEQGMSGALALQPNLLTGKTLLNLDSEEDDTFTIGCAGGVDTLISHNYPESTHSHEHPFIALRVTGLRGGHSGLQIHEGRANAIKLITRILHACGEEVAALNSLHAGSARNAIPAQGTAQIVLLDPSRFETIFSCEVTQIRDEFQLIEPHLQVTTQPIESPHGPIPAMAADSQKALILALQSVTNGVYRMSPVVPGLAHLRADAIGEGIRRGRGDADVEGQQGEGQAVHVFVQKVRVLGDSCSSPTSFQGKTACSSGRRR